MDDKKIIDQKAQALPTATTQTEPPKPAPTVHDFIKEAMNKNAASLSPDKQAALEKVMLKVLEDGMSPGEAMGFNKQTYDFAYDHAYQLFTAGKYKEALGVFVWLKTMQPTNYLYAFNIAACYHYTKDYDNAIRQYLMSALLEPDNPEPYFYVANCFLSANNEPCAIMYLKETLARTKDKPKYEEMNKLAGMALDGLVHKIHPDEHPGAQGVKQ